MSKNSWRSFLQILKPSHNIRTLKSNHLKKMTNWEISYLIAELLPMKLHILQWRFFHNSNQLQLWAKVVSSDPWLMNPWLFHPESDLAMPSVLYLKMNWTKIKIRNYTRNKHEIVISKNKKLMFIPWRICKICQVKIMLSNLKQNIGSYKLSCLVVGLGWN